MFNKTILALLVLFLSACGGGGGSGGSNEPDSLRTGARVLHGAIEAAPVDLVSSLQGVVQTAKFAESSGYVELLSGTQLLNLYRTKDLSSALVTRQITNNGDQKHTLVFYGDRDNFGLRATLISEDLPEVPDGASLVRIIHAAVGAGSLEIGLPSGAVVAGFGSASTYATVTPGVVRASIIRTVDRTLVDSLSFSAQEGKAYSIFVAGEIGYLVQSKVLEEN